LELTLMFPLASKEWNPFSDAESPDFFLSIGLVLWDFLGARDCISS
jgi:hypothetical protein